MAKHVVLSLPRVTINTSGLRIIKPPVLSFKVEVEFDRKIEKEAAKDPLLLQGFQAAAKEIHDQTVKMVEKKCRVFEKLFEGMIAKGADDKMMEKQLDGLNKALTQDFKVAEAGATQAVTKVWTNLVAKRKEWRNFKLRVAATITGTVAGLAVSIAGMASAPFTGGASGALGIIGLVKSANTLVVEIGKLAISIDQAKKILETNLKVVETTVKKKAGNVANEVSAAVLNEILGISQPSIKTCEGACDTLKAKYARMVVHMHDASKKLNKILAQQDKLKKDFMAEVDRRLKDHPTPSPGAQRKVIEKQLDHALAANYAKVDHAIGKVSGMYATAAPWAKEVKKLSDRVDVLSARDMKGLKIFREALSVAMLATSVIDGNKIATGAAELAGGLGEAVGGYAFDKIAAKAIDGSAFDI